MCLWVRPPLTRHCGNSIWCFLTFCNSELVHQGLVKSCSFVRRTCDKWQYDRCYRNTEHEVNGVKSPPFIILMSSVKAHSWSGSLPEAVADSSWETPRIASSLVLMNVSCAFAWICILYICVIMNAYSCSTFRAQRGEIQSMYMSFYSDVRYLQANRSLIS